MSRRFFGFHRAEVTEVDIKLEDENNDYGAVRVFIPDIMTIDDPVYDPSKMGLIAFPANNPVGGRNDQNDGSYGWGTVMVPRVGDWVWVFFEAGDPSKPFYFSALNIKNTKLPPENRDVTEPHKVYTLLKTYDGRSIIVSDSSDVQRIELTGKYRNGNAEEPDGDDTDPYTIDDNQTTILFDERSGKEKILIRTHKGDFLHIDVDEQQLQAYFTDDIVIKTDANLHLQVANDVHFKVGGNMYTEIDKDKHCTVSGSIYRQSFEDRHERVLGNLYESIEGDMNIKVTDDLNIEVGGDFSLKSTGKINEESGTNISIKSGVNYALDAVKIDIKSSGVMSIESGAAYNLLAAGTITTHGTMRMDQAGAPASSGTITSPTSPTEAENATPSSPEDPEGERDT
jgi:hypothetical protein